MSAAIAREAARRPRYRCTCGAVVVVIGETVVETSPMRPHRTCPGLERRESWERVLRRRASVTPPGVPITVPDTVVGACCELARRTTEWCTCQAVTSCPTHGRRHVGTHS